MTVEGGASSVGAPADEDAFEKQMRLNNEATAEQLRASTAPRYVKPQALDQLEEWMKENPIPYISNDKFSQTVPWLTCIWRRDRASLFFFWKTA